MTDDDKKKIFSEPPPPTDEIDGEWGEDDETLVREAPVVVTSSHPPAPVPEAVTGSQPAPPGNVVSQTAVAPISEPPKAASPASQPPKAASPASQPPKAAAPSTAAAAVDEDEDEDEEYEDEDEDEEYEDEDEADGASAQPTHREAQRAAGDWIPEWAPYAVLAALVTVSIVFGLGLLGGPEVTASEEEAAAAATTVKPQPSALKAKPSRPSPHP